MALGVLSVALMVLDARQDHLATLRSTLSFVLQPVQYLVDLPMTAARFVRDSLATRQRLIEENSSLRAQRLLLEGQMQRLLSLETENARLRDLLSSSFRVGDRMTIAELLTVDMDPFQQLVTINKGRLHDVETGLTVLDAQGVMGQVIRVATNSATVMLITDPSHAIPVAVNRNGLRTIALGTGATGALELPYLANTADVRPGDLLVTSGLGGRFPPGYPVAVIENVQQDPGRGLARVRARPTALIEQSREVLLIWRTAPPASVVAHPGEAP